MTDQLPDRWTTRDYPVLLKVARGLDAGERVSFSLGLGHNAELAACQALNNVYLTGKPLRGGGQLLAFTVDGLTEKGYREVGLWPNGEGVEALVDALRQAAEATDDEDEKGRLRRAAEAVGNVSKEVMISVGSAWLTKLSMGG